MAYLPSQEEFRDFLSGTGTITLTSGGAGAGTVQDSAAQQPSAPKPTTSTNTSPSVPRESASVSSDLSNARGSLRNISSDFYSQAGPSRSYESSGAQGALDKGIAPGASTQDVGFAKGFVNASYSGPSAFDSDRFSSARGSVQDIAQRAYAARTGSGLQGMYAWQGLTPGQARFEAKRTLQSPGYQSDAMRQYQAAQSLLTEMESRARRAEQFGKQRTAEEEEIAKKSTDYLTGKRSALEDAIAAALAEKEQDYKSRAAAYENFLSAPDAGMAGNLEAYKSLPADYLSSPGAFNTEARTAAIESQRMWDEIMAKYPQLQDQPTLGLDVTSHGREEDWMGPGRESPENKRQRELAALFSPGTAGGSVASSPEALAGLEFAQYNPLYFGDPINLPGIKNYVSFDPGIRPSRENVSTAEQRRLFGAINNVLDNLGRIAETEPYRAAMIGVDLDNYLLDEENALKEQKGKITAEQKEWRQKVAQARKRFKKARKEEAWGDVARTIGAVGSLGGSEALGQGIDEIARALGADIPTYEEISRGTGKTAINGSMGVI